MSLKEGLAELIIRKRDYREKEIKTLLEKAMEEWPKNVFTGREYLRKAISLKEVIFKEKGEIYFIKYPEIPNMINSLIKKFIGDETKTNNYHSFL